jgi:hypothetical protein
MLLLDKNNLQEFIIVTLTELTTIVTQNLNYLFVFTHTETKTQVKVIFKDSEDLSAFKYRFNKWVIATSETFLNAPTGEYLYDAYEQESETDETTEGKNKVEEGKLFLLENDFTFEKYNTATSYKSYNG